jgi:dipeptidyl aminopeptidase/acylaminoacyl peptidase
MPLKHPLILLTLLIPWNFTFLHAQDPTDLYLFQLHKTADQKYHLYDATYLSGFNPNGYTNQPWFTPEGNLLVSVRKAGEKQNDIYRLSLQDNTIKRLTQTKANEYSPRITPDGQRLSVVRQVEGDSIDQQVFQVALKGGRYTSLTPGIKDIGYYTWVGNDQLALFRIDGESSHLVVLNLKDDRSRRVTSSIGRTLLTDVSGGILFVHKFTDTYWYLKKYNPASSMIDIIAETPGLAEDFTVAPDGTCFLGIGSMLYSFHPGSDKLWQEVGDLSIHGITHITRLAISPDGNQLALVATK